MRVRLINCLIDFFVFLIVFGFLYKFTLDTIAAEDIKWIALGLYFGYYFGFELFLGQTIGKMITKTKVATVDQSKPGLLQIFLRSVMRLIVLDLLSYLFSERGLHDRISKTTLVSTKG